MFNQFLCQEGASLSPFPYAHETSFESENKHLAGNLKLLEQIKVQPIAD